MKKFFIAVFLLSAILLSGCPPPPGELCGNGVIDPDENCLSCPADVKCGGGEVCVGGICELLCGNGRIDVNENCSNCPADVICEKNEECVEGVCKPLCGNGRIDEGENCLSCPSDVVCEEGEECIEEECVLIELCGNGAIDEGENCSNCPADVLCGEDEECVDGNCVKKVEPSQSKAHLRVNGVNQYLAVGEGIRVYGVFEYSGQSFDVVLDSIVKTGPYRYEARFNLRDSDNNVVAATTIAPDNELIFYDEEDVEIRVDAYIYLVAVLVTE